MANKEIQLEKQAQESLANGDTEQAHSLLKQAAISYAQSGNHKQAALMFASAASVWGGVYGDRSLYLSAQLYERGAKQAIKYGDYEYSALLYKYAAINYERDGEFESFSNCFYNSKESRRKSLLSSKKKSSNSNGLKRFFRWMLMTISCFSWGYGEKPFRTLMTGIAVVFLSALGYVYGGLVRDGLIFDPSYFEALYFSVATITTLGYGDISPTGFSQPIAMLEAFCGIFIMPIFIVGLSRKYLRI